MHLPGYMAYVHRQQYGDPRCRIHTFGTLHGSTGTRVHGLWVHGSMVYGYTGLWVHWSMRGLKGTFDQKTRKNGDFDHFLAKPPKQGQNGNFRHFIEPGPKQPMGQKWIVFAFYTLCPLVYLNGYPNLQNPIKRGLNVVEKGRK